MKQRKDILWWLRRRHIARTRIVQSNEKKNIIIKKEEKEIKVEPQSLPSKNEIVPEQPSISITEENNIIASPVERELPNKKNERITLIKPNRKVGTNESFDKVDKSKKDEKENQETHKEIKEKEEFDKDFINEQTVLNDVSINIDTLDEIEKMLITNYSEIQNIKYELNVLEQKEEEEIITEEVERLIEELKQLIKKFEKIKKDFYSSNLVNIYNHSSNNNYIELLINEYKTSVKENHLTEEIINGMKQIEEYISLINDIIEVESLKDNVEQKLNTKKENLDIRDNEFENLKIEYSNIEKMNHYLDGFSKEYNIIIKDIESKVAQSEQVKKTAEYKSELVINHSKLLASTLLLASTPMIPCTKGGSLLRLGLMMGAIGGLASSFKVRTRESKVTTHINFTDYAKDIQTSINSVQDMSLMIDKTRLDIKNIKSEFIREFGEYITRIPEYAELMANLDTVEKTLLIQASIAKEYDKKLEQTLEENNVKVKRLEEDIIN